MKPFNISPASKYRAKKVEIDGITFASKKEAGVYMDLKTQKAAGEILDFKLQVPYELVPKQTEIITSLVNGKLKTKEKIVEHPVKYVADFVVYHTDGEVAVIDVKGFPDQKFPIKRKLMLWRHKIKVVQV